MAEAYNTPVAGANQPADDNEQRIDGDGQEVNALRFMGLGAGGAPVPPPPAITPVTPGVSQPVQPPQQQPVPPQAPLQPPQIPQHQQPMPAPAGYDFPDPAAYASMQIPSGPMSNPYGMPGQMPGVMGGGPMMMMPPYNYMYAHQPFYMPGPYQTMPSAPSTKSQLVGYLNALRVQQPKVYRDWHKKYTAHMRNPERIPFPDVPGYVKGHGGPPQFAGRSRKESTRSSVNGDPYRPGHGESFADFGGANSSMSHVFPRGHDRHRPSHSGRASVNGDYRHHPEDEFEIDGADISMLSGTGGHSLINTSHYAPSERDRPSNQSGRSSTVGDYNRPDEVYGGFVNQQPDSFSSNYDTSGRYQPDVREPSPKRNTPLKFSTFNWIAVPSPLGHLIRIKHGTVMELVKLKQFLGHLPEYKEMESFPGPLISRVTHKHTVIQFCKRKIKEAQSNSAQVDRDNFILIWKFLMLMIKQNGHVVGTDIAELLMTAVEEEKKAIVVEEIRDDVEGREDEEIEDTPAAPIEPTPPPVVEPKDEEKLVEQFCEHLLYGHRKDALDFAMDNGLWGHALFFASKMDDRLNGNVLARFANGIAMNSPLQTLYHIICGKQPASVTSCADESFGDWKPHLAMLLSNSGKNPEVEHRAMLTLGDTLANRNHLYAAQFCYLMAQDEFRIGSRIGHLLGYSPDAKNVLEATQMTEVYEFALKLQEGHPPPLGLSFLESKLEYAKQLVNLGFIQEALAYCEEITKTLDITAKKLESRELTLCANTLQIAERIALADESGEASKVESWVGNLKRIIANPTAFDENSRKLTTQSSQEQSSEVPYTSPPQQQQVVSNETYDPTLYNQQQLLPPDMSSVSQNQYDIAGVPGVAINHSTNVPPENTMTGGGSANVQENNWSNPIQMNGGFHITQPMYDVTQQLSQMTLNTNTEDSTSHYSNNPDGNYPSYDGGYASTGGYDKQPNVAMNNNNYYYNQNQPYDPQPTVGMNENIAPYKEQEYNHTSAIKKKSVRFEDEHERHADVENSIGGNNGVSVLRSRAPVRPDTLDLKSAMKSTIDRHEAGNRRPNFMNGSIDTTDSKKSSDESSSPDKSLFEVEYKSTYPIDEPIESVSRLNSSSSNFNNKLRPAPSSSYEYHNTFPVDRECCDVDEPCEDHDDYLGDDSENGVPDFTSKCTGYEKTEPARNTLPPQGSGNKGNETKKKGNENTKGGLDNNQQQQPGWFSGLFKFSLKPKNQMKLPDDKNPTIVWDANKKIWVNTAADGEEDSAPAGPPPKDSDLMRGSMPNGPMSMPPPNNRNNMQSVPPSANNMQTSQPNMSYQQAPAALHSLPNQMPTMNQPSQNHPGMMNVSQQQPQLSNSEQPMIPGMPPVSNNSMNKYKLQKGRSLKNSYVDVLNPNSSPRSPSEPPQLPINNVSSPQVPNLFIPPPTNSGGDGPVSFLTAPSEEGPPGQDNSQVQAPPMFNPAQFQNPGYPQGQ